MNILKSNVLSPSSSVVSFVRYALIVVFLAGAAIGALCGYRAGMRDGLTVGAFSREGGKTPEGLTSVVLTQTSEGVATCKEIMELYQQLPIDELLDRPALLDQVGDCTLAALESDCGITDPLACATDVWHAIVD